MQFYCRLLTYCTGKSFSEALILASTNPQYDKRLFLELPLKLYAKNMFCACSFHGNSMNNFLSYCGLIDAKLRVSDKDLPRLVFFSISTLFKIYSNYCLTSY